MRRMGCSLSSLMSLFIVKKETCYLLITENKEHLLKWNQQQSITALCPVKSFAVKMLPWFLSDMIVCNTVKV